MLGVLDPTIRAKSDCGCARSLNSFWPPILRSQRPKKNVSLLMQKIQKRVQMARVVFIKFAQQIVIVRFSACAVPHVSSEKETRSKSLRRSRQRKSIFMWLFRITQTHDGGLKVCAQACARRFGFCYPSSGELWTPNGWNSLQQPCMCCF